MNQETLDKMNKSLIFGLYHPEAQIIVEKCFGMIAEFENKHCAVNMNRSDVINLFIDDMWNQICEIDI